MNYALITGASAGIGREFAFEIAKLGNYKLILVARRLERLEELKKTLKKEFQHLNHDLDIICFKCDLTNKNDIDDLLLFIGKNNLKIALLINNAGFGSLGTFASKEVENEVKMLKLNCIAPLILCHYFCNNKKKDDFLYIINVSSIASFVPMPYMATYAATKAFLTSFSIALARENQGNKIRILTLCPGPTDSEFHLVVGLENKIKYLPGNSANMVAKVAIDSLFRKQTLKVTGWLNVITRLLCKVFGARFSSKVVRLLLQKYS